MCGGLLCCGVLCQWPFCPHYWGESWCDRVRPTVSFSWVTPFRTLWSGMGWRCRWSGWWFSCEGLVRGLCAGSGYSVGCLRADVQKAKDRCTYCRRGCTRLNKSCGDMSKGEKPCTYDPRGSIPCTINVVIRSRVKTLVHITEGVQITCTSATVICTRVENGVHITARSVLPYASVAVICTRL